MFLFDFLPEKWQKPYALLCLLAFLVVFTALTTFFNTPEGVESIHDSQCGHDLDYRAIWPILAFVGAAQAALITWVIAFIGALVYERLEHYRYRSYVE